MILMKKLFLIAGICFYLAAVLSFFSAADNKAITIGVFGSLGTAFIVIYNLQKKSPKSK